MTYLYAYMVILIIFIYIYIYSFIYYNIPKPYEFLSTNLRSDLDITDIITQINTLLPQLNDFITQFNSLVVKSGVNVITDSAGNMSIDVPQSMSDLEANDIGKRISIIDRLITTHGSSINDLFKKGLSMEDKLKIDNPNYTSQLTEKILEFKRLNASYKH